MTLSLRELSRVVELSSPRLRGARVRAVHDDGEATLYLTLRVPGENLLLVVSASRREGRIALVDSDRPTAPAQPMSFTQLLRKHLIGAVVETISCPVEGDRIAALVLTRRVHESAENQDGAGEIKTLHWTLLVELLGRETNIFLLDGNANVVGALRSGRLARVPVGEVWTPPPPPPPRTRKRESRDRFGHRNEGEAEQTKQADRVEGPCALGREIEAHYAEQIATRQWRTRRDRLERALERTTSRLSRRLEAVERDLERAAEAESFREWADILAANFNELERGMEEVELENFYDEMKPVEIPLDPMLAPRENIDRYYRRYKRLNSARPKIESRRDKTETRLLEIELLRDSLDALEAHAESADDALEGLVEEARKLGVTPRRPRRERRKAQKRTRAAPARPYREFVSERGLRIWVGKSAQDNDQLTFHHARGNDYWLHAAGHAGSHVVVRLNSRGEIDRETLLDAATLAAHYSQAGAGAVVDVHYTRRKNVRRARGGPSGRVYLGGAKTLTVRVDRDRLRRLKESRPDDARA